MRFLLSTLIIFISISLSGKNAYVDFNQLYFEGKGYTIANVKGQSTLWTWQNKTLNMSNFSAEVNENNEYPATESWVILGPYDLSLSDSAAFEFKYVLDYGVNATSVVASADFNGYKGEPEMPGTWAMVLESSEIIATQENETKFSASLKAFAGKKKVYVAFKYEMPLSDVVGTNTIKEFGITRSVNPKVEELLPAVEISRSKEGSDFFNMNGTDGETAKWSVRTGYAKASSGNNLWLVFRSFNLTTSGDAFFSFASMLTNGTNGPQGLEVKVAREKFEDGDFVGDLQWEDYSKGRVDHRNFPTDYWESGLLDLSNYLGDWVTVAFRYINPEGEQYSIRDFKMYHLADVTAPVIQKAEVSRLVYNRAYFSIQANEAASFSWGIYPEGAVQPSFEDLHSGTNALYFGSYDYEEAFKDSTFVLDTLSENTKYTIYYALEDFNANHTDVLSVEIETPDKDIDAPQLLDAQFAEIKNFSCRFEFRANEACTYYLLIQHADSLMPSPEELIAKGRKGIFEDAAKEQSFYNLTQNTSYNVYWLGVDYAGNVSELKENLFVTENRDLKQPVVSHFEELGVSDFQADFSLTVDEQSTAYYVLQSRNEIAPDVEGILSGERAILKDTFNYSTENTAFEFSIIHLDNASEYFLYLVAKDTASNYSNIIAYPFSTSSTSVPEIAKVSDDRLIIDREATFTFSEDMIQITNGVSTEGYKIHIFENDGYQTRENGIIANDNFTGYIRVPVCLYKDSVQSNILDFNIIVDYQTVQDSLRGIRRNMYGGHLSNAVDDLPTSLALLQLREDGSFFDQPSTLSAEYAEYMTKILGGRFINIARDYYQEKFRVRKANEVRHKLYLALEYWLDNKPEYTVPETPLFQPEYLGAVMLSIYDDMMYEYRTSTSYDEQIERLIAKIDSFNVWCWKGSEKSDFYNAYTGYNLGQRAWGTMALAAVTGNVELSFDLFDKIEESLVANANTSTFYPSGLMPDGSFTKNNASGSLWNWYNYGYVWLEDVLELADVTKFTNWRLSKDKFELLSLAVKDGADWLHWRDIIPFHLLGKSSTESGTKNRKSIHLNALNLLRYESFLQNSDLKDNEVVYEDYVEHTQLYRFTDSTKYFWNANAMIHSRGNFISTLFVPSNRTGAFETGKDTIQGLQNYFMGDGAIFSLSSEEGYAKRHLLNYAKLPGTTVERRVMDLTYNIEGKNGTHKNEFAGGLSNGRQGISTFYYDRAKSLSNVKGYKSYFFFNDGYVALGAGLNKIVQNKVYDVATTLEQEVLENDISYSITKGQIASISGSQTNLSKDFEVTEPSWFYASGKGFYLLPSDGEASLYHIDVEERRESWDVFNGTDKIKMLENPNYNPSYNTDHLYTLDIKHGKEFQDAKYAYMVTPGMGESQFIPYAENQPISVIANSDSIQAVYHKKDNAYGIVFIQSGEVQITNAVKLTASQPAIVLLKQNDEGEWEAWLSDPTQKQDMVQLTFEITRENEVPRTIQRIVVFPSGKNVGATAYTSTGNVWSQIPAQEIKEKFAVEPMSDPEIEDISNPEGKDVKQIGQDENKHPFNLNVYPVPVNKQDMLHASFNLQESGHVSFTIFGLKGNVEQQVKRYYRAGEYSASFSTSSLASGYYYLVVLNGKHKEIVPFVVQ